MMGRQHCTVAGIVAVAVVVVVAVVVGRGSIAEFSWRDHLQRHPPSYQVGSTL